MKLKRKHWWLYSVLIVLLLLIIAMILLPRLSKNYIVVHGKELTGRKLHIDNIKVNYLKSAVTILGFKMYEANDQDVFTSFDTLFINTIPYKYFSNTKALDQFYLQGLKLNIVKKDSTYNFDDLVQFFSQQDTLSEPANEEEFKYLLQNIELKHAEITFHETDIDNTTKMQDLSFVIPYVAWDQEHDSKADMTFNFERGGSLQAAFNAHPKTMDFNGSLIFNNIDLSSFNKHVASYANIHSVQGFLNANLQLEGNINQPDDMVVFGDTEVLDFALTDQNDSLFYAAQRMSTQYEEIKALKQSYKLKTVVIEQPYIKFKLDSVSNNWFRIFNIDAETDSTYQVTNVRSLEVADSTSLYYAIGNIKVNQGVMDYTDHLTGQPFHYHLSDIKMDTDRIDSQSDWVDVNSEMLLNNRGTLKAKVGVNPIDPMNASIDIAIKDFVLSDINIYSNYYTGHSILEGDMYYFSKTVFDQGNIESSNHLLIKDVSVTNNKNGIMSLPLKFAIFLLKDKNGDIELEVPVRGNLNEPEVDVWSLVGTTLKKIIFGATDNPTKKLAKLVDTKPEDLQQLVFKYPDTLLTEKHQEQISKILELEQLKPELNITMSYTADPLELKKIISETTATTSSTTAVTSDSINSNPKQNQSVETKLTDTTVPEQPALDSLVTQYKEALMRQMQTYLNAQAPQTAIELQVMDEFDPDTMAAEPQFKMSYQLKETQKED